MKIVAIDNRPEKKLSLVIKNKIFHFHSCTPLFIIFDGDFTKPQT